ncbi:uncharacterized protein LOC126687779 [Mercurialis annua]|uniref:uncharacterized protein LOC126687779 n=1 Tax=Mercurialis annua TaxID=3986 RepID=UPI00215E0576|nr:uncharacterized protein LOC126687779 [Mercurialis annua]
MYHQRAKQIRRDERPLSPTNTGSGYARSTTEIPPLPTLKADIRKPSFDLYSDYYLSILGGAFRLHLQLGLNEDSDPLAVLTVADRLHDDCSKALQSSEPATRSSPEVHLWQPPPINIIKVNFDGAFNRATCTGTGACVARNHNGKPIHSHAQVFNHVQSPMVVEALALREAILVARRLQVMEIIFEGDAKCIIDAMKGELSVDLDCDVILEDCRRLCQTFRLVSFEFIRRSGNWVANYLAKRSLRDNLFCYNTLAQLTWLESRLM